VTYKSTIVRLRLSFSIKSNKNQKLNLKWVVLATLESVKECRYLGIVPTLNGSLKQHLLNWLLDKSLLCSWKQSLIFPIQSHSWCAISLTFLSTRLQCYVGQSSFTDTMEISMVKHWLRFCSALGQYSIKPATHNYVWAPSRNV